ncbi:MAG: hypothetical protein JSW61_06305 [Candidatus Thorarchaeota archaeon]|nr:MAG: hypothetical protein JSW61_06305 [Candidatus Thorarchaeota archaeon]
MAKEALEHVYAYCTKCNENILLEIDDEEIQSSSGGITAVLSVHGSPQHAALVYVDKQLKVRGIEYPSIVQVAENQEAITEAAELTEVPEHNLESVVSSFGDRQESAVETLASVLVQLMIRNPVYLIHNNQDMGKVVEQQLEALFERQETPMQVISYDELESVEGMRPSVFDLQTYRFVSEGASVDSEYFEELIYQGLEDDAGFSSLKSELSKLTYSYRRICDLLTVGAKRFEIDNLARLAQIKKSLMPLLLRMAEAEGVDVGSRVRGRIRS